MERQAKPASFARVNALATLALAKFTTFCKAKQVSRAAALEHITKPGIAL